MTKSKREALQAILSGRRRMTDLPRHGVLIVTPTAIPGTVNVDGKEMTVRDLKVKERTAEMVMFWPDMQDDFEFPEGLTDGAQVIDFMDEGEPDELEND